jgi:hypothetical protein
MQRTFATALFAAASLMASTGASAQNRQQATVPFDFTVGQSSFPAGTYMISYVGPSLISVRGWKGNELVSALTLVTVTDAVRKNPDKLIFHKYGDQYFLSEVRGDVGEAASKIRTSKLEQRIQLQQAAVAHQDETEIALKE